MNDGQKQYTGEKQQARTYDLHRLINNRLFDGRLAECVLTYEQGKYRGYFQPRKWSRTAGEDKATTPTICLNPLHFKDGDKRVLSTLVHEMVHQWIDECGPGSRGAYHCKAWGEKMESIGLIPSSTGEPGGKRTGQSVSHYIIPGGLFDQLADEIITAGLLTELYAVANAPKAKKTKDRVKYTCPSCQSNIWGKPGLLVMCEDCEEHFIEGGK